MLRKYEHRNIENVYIIIVCGNDRIDILQPICLENIALHKAAWQQTPSYHDDSLAVDGRKENLYERGGECVASGKNNTAEWRVDLESVLSIHHIVIQYIQSKAVWGIYCCFLAYLTYI